MAEQVAVEPEPYRVQGEPVRLPELSLEKLTVPLGVVGLASLSVTAAVQVVGAPTNEEPGQVTLVVVLCGFDEITMTLAEVESYGPLRRMESETSY